MSDSPSTTAFARAKAAVQQGVLASDPWLEHQVDKLAVRYAKYESVKHDIEQSHGSLIEFADSYKRYGVMPGARPGEIVVREWAPNAASVSLVGEFNGWNRDSHACTRDEFGTWSLVVPALPSGRPAVEHGSRVKLHMRLADGTRFDRFPSWTHRVIEDPPNSGEFHALYWDSGLAPYNWRHERPVRPEHLRIYEAHVGISSPEPRVCTYGEFTRDVLPWIARCGYNAVQLMAIMEHVYYGSFGYQVTSFFAASSRYGTPAELMELIDTAHGLGMRVFLDIVHSHASKNTLDGLNNFDGSDHHLFHGGAAGVHTLWDSRLFNYGNFETLRFLLANVKYYLDEFHLDGFRFDGVTSMLYKHHGIAHGFSGSYDEYFGPDTDLDACVYLMLANELIHVLHPDNISIAEDVSGMPTLGRPVAAGGLGFDYRLAMSIPDMWIKLLKERPDESWSMGDLVFTLENRRTDEASICYCESHDQALVGDKTIAFWLMDADMYTHMTCLVEPTDRVTRGIALHKMIRLLTISLGGEAWLAFEGNEFGSPEWLDFPRAGNNWSFHYARRQFNLVSDPLLRYKFLANFDSAMCRLASSALWHNSLRPYVSLKHEEDKLIAFDTDKLLFVFNFHPTKTFADYRIGVRHPGRYVVELDTDDRDMFGGFSRNSSAAEHFSVPEPWHDRPAYVLLYIPSRSACVYRLLD